MKEKMKRLKIAKHMSKLPVLIHVGGVDEEVVESGFFAKIIEGSYWKLPYNYSKICNFSHVCTRSRKWAASSNLSSLAARAISFL